MKERRNLMGSENSTTSDRQLRRRRARTCCISSMANRIFLILAMTTTWMLLDHPPYSVYAFQPFTTISRGNFLTGQRRDTSFAILYDKEKPSRQLQQPLFLFPDQQTEPPNEEESYDTNALVLAGLLSQPVVWVSVASVATTGAGLPAGPFGLLGAVEGISYLLVVGWVAWGILPFSNQPDAKEALSNPSPADDPTSLVVRVSTATLGLGVLVLFKLIADQGCIPNAKPILDYSNYVRVCDPTQTPGLFGG